MAPRTKEPELSVIVPVLNERGMLPALFATLAAQRDVNFEIVVSDGGSSDDTAEAASGLAASWGLPALVLTGEKGRGRQMNAGASASKGSTLLFLHADSSFADCSALRKGLDALADAIAERRSERIAGHFALRFDRTTTGASPGYYYYECKARLNRRDCTHGDQGFMLRRSFFGEVGPFDGSLPMLAETRLAEKIRHRGGWLLLPAEIHTSARRLETEGLRPRQTLNAIIMNFAAIGWDPFFREIPHIYTGQDHTGRFHLFPFLNAVRRLLADIPWRERFSLWHATGAYVRDHAWQLAFALDTMRNFRRGVAAGDGTTPCLSFYDLHLDRLTDHPPGRLVTATLVWIWFRLTLAHAYLAEGKKY